MAAEMFSFERLILVGLFTLAGALGVAACFLTLYGSGEQSSRLVEKFCDIMSMVVIAIVALMKDVFGKTHSSSSSGYQPPAAPQPQQPQ